MNQNYNILVLNSRKIIETKEPKNIQMYGKSKLHPYNAKYYLHYRIDKTEEPEYALGLTKHSLIEDTQNAYCNVDSNWLKDNKECQASSLQALKTAVESFKTPEDGIAYTLDNNECFGCFLEEIKEMITTLKDDI